MRLITDWSIRSMRIAERSMKGQPIDGEGGAGGGDIPSVVSWSDRPGANR